MKNLSLTRRARFAALGIAAACRRESSFRTELTCFGLLIVALLIFRPPLVWCGLCILNAALVLAAELLNTSIETLLDHLHPDIHPAIQVAKDCGAGAVMVLCASAVVIGAMTVIAAIPPA